MLDISDNILERDEKEYSELKSVQRVNRLGTEVSLAKVLGFLFIVFMITLFLPWTQSVEVGGVLTSLRPGERHQTIHATISGRLEQWYVLEGQRVNKGDTIVKLSEVKSDYFSPELISRLKDQIDAKEKAIQSYKEKIDALKNQQNALVRSKNLKYAQYTNKIKQYQLKLNSDSINYVAAKVKIDNALNQYERSQKLYAQGLISLTKLQETQQKFQEANAGYVGYENKYISSQNDLENIRMDLANIINEYTDKISKSQSDMFSGSSSLYEGEEKLATLKLKYDNSVIRNGFYYITAPQDGYITKAQVVGLGEIVKEGYPVVSIMPRLHSLAAELYVKPVDLPLIEVHHKVRLQFDGWPSIVASGWPDVAYGTFSGEIVAVDNMISPNGKYRILVAPDGVEDTGGEWPHELRLGSGAKGFALLNIVPIWWEMWRRMSGFPPEWYDKSKEHPYIHDKKESKEKKEGYSK